jgi:hypothetical protein
MPPVYTTQVAFEAYVEGWVTDNAQALERLLMRAERDIDRILPYRYVDPTTSPLKVDPLQLTVAAREGLSRATCAQAIYRFRIGEEHFETEQYESVAGPDFTVKGKLPKIATAAREELRKVGLSTRWANVV